MTRVQRRRTPVTCFVAVVTAAVALTLVAGSAQAGPLRKDLPTQTATWSVTRAPGETGVLAVRGPRTWDFHEEHATDTGVFADVKGRWSLVVHTAAGITGMGAALRDQVAAARAGQGIEVLGRSVTKGPGRRTTGTVTYRYTVPTGAKGVRVVRLVKDGRTKQFVLTVSGRGRVDLPGLGGVLDRATATISYYGG